MSVAEVVPAVPEEIVLSDGEEPMVWGRRLTRDNAPAAMQGTYGPIEYALNRLCLRSLQVRLARAAAACAVKAEGHDPDLD